MSQYFLSIAILYKILFIFTRFLYFTNTKLFDIINLSTGGKENERI